VTPSDQKTPTLLEALAYINGLSTRDLCRVLGVKNSKSIRRWIYGTRFPNKASQLRLFYTFGADAETLLKRLPVPGDNGLYLGLPRFVESSKK